MSTDDQQHFLRESLAEIQAMQARMDGYVAAIRDVLREREPHLSWDPAQPIAETYTYTVRWSPRKAMFVATAVEFPGLTAAATTPTWALREIIGRVREALDELRRHGGTVPPPREE